MAANLPAPSRPARASVDAVPVEYVVLVDDAGTPLGTAPKAAVHTADTPLHLAFSAYLFDDAGRFLLTRRALGKRTWPGVWTNSCCGHPAPGEATEAAVRRRVREELGAAVAGLAVVLPQFRYRAVLDGVVEHEICPVYAGTLAGPLAPDPAEVGEHRWVDWAALRDGTAAPDGLSPWCLLQLEQLPADLPERVSAARTR